MSLIEMKIYVGEVKTGCFASTRSYFDPFTFRITNQRKVYLRLMIIKIV